MFRTVRRELVHYHPEAVATIAAYAVISGLVLVRIGQWLAPK